MSVTSAWQWPADLIEFATRRGAVQYLEPLREMTQRLFPTARSLAIFKEDDPELRDVTSIVFEVRVPIQDVPDFIEANHRWGEEQSTICPVSRDYPIVLTLIREA
jgi:hypothetical protein